MKHLKKQHRASPPEVGGRTWTSLSCKPCSTALHKKCPIELLSPQKSCFLPASSSLIFCFFYCFAFMQKDHFSFHFILQFSWGTERKKAGEEHLLRNTLCQSPVSFSTKALTGVDRAAFPPHADLSWLCRSLWISWDSVTLLHCSPLDEVMFVGFSLQYLLLCEILPSDGSCSSMVLQQRGLPAALSLLLF